MKGQVFTIAKLHYINGVVYHVEQFGIAKIEEMANKFTETTKSGKAKHPRVRVRTLARFAVGLGLINFIDKETVALTGLGKEYCRSKLDDKWSLSEHQKKLMRDHILKNPSRTKTAFAINQLLNLVSAGIKGTELTQKYAEAIGKQDLWKSTATFEGFTEFGLNYLKELGFMDSTTENTFQKKLPIDRKNRIKQLYKNGYTKEEAVKIIEKEYPPGTLSATGMPYKSSHKADVQLVYYEFSQFGYSRKNHSPKFWWVTQNQTQKQEIDGGYMWSPKTKKDGTRNTFYDNMTKVNPGDIVFSFVGGRITHLGVIASHCYSRLKPDFGSAGDAWDQDGWMVNVDYRPVRNKIRPKEHIEWIRPYLPSKYSPLQQTGDGNQGVYLANINNGLAGKLLELIGEEVDLVLIEAREHEGGSITDLEADEERIEKLIKKDPVLPILRRK